MLASVQKLLCANFAGTSKNCGEMHCNYCFDVRGQIEV